MREIRKKSASGHQTSIITTNYLLPMVRLALLMFARWCQENFFKYLVESFGIDSITSYQKNKIPDTSFILNPQYQDLDRQHRRTSAQLSQSMKKYAQITLSDKELSGKALERYAQKKSEKQQEIEMLTRQKQEIIEKKKNVDRKIAFSDLDDNQKFDTSINERKFFMDTIKIIAYRAETAMTNLIKKQISSPERARSLIRRLYTGEADLEVDNKNQIMTVKLHRTNHWADDKILEELCHILNQTQTVFPESNLVLYFNLVSL